MSHERYSSGFRRSVRNAKAEFRQAGTDIRNYSSVRELLEKIIPDYNERFSKYDGVFADWHNVRVQILDLPIGNDFLEKSNELRTEFQKKYDMPQRRKQDPNFWDTVKPVLKQITDTVAKGR